MRTRRQEFIGALIVGLIVGLVDREAAAKPTEAQTCEVAKLVAGRRQGGLPA